MKKPLCPPPFAVLGAILLWAGSGPDAQANISGINTPLASYGLIDFDDTKSLNTGGFPGSLYNVGVPAGWGGTTVSMLQTDGTTSDFAQGDLDGSFIPFTPTYAINFNNVTLTQAPLNTGQALLHFTFNIQFQLDAAGLPLQGTLFPNFLVSGTVQSPAGSFASVGGTIDYYGVNNTAGTVNLLDTVTYNSSWLTPGSFGPTVAPGTPGSGTTPTLAPNTTLTLVGDIRFIVDPATMSIQSVQAPEPTVGLLAVVAAVPLLARRRRTGLAR